MDCHYDSSTLQFLTCAMFLITMVVVMASASSDNDTCLALRRNPCESLNSTVKLEKQATECMT